MHKSLTMMAFDYGARRVGVAVGNSMTRVGQALKTIAAPSSDALFKEIESILKEWQPDQLVVGRPIHPDGAPHEMTAKAVRFGNQLHGRFHLPVHWVDERYSSVVLEGNADMHDNLDAHSAATILDQFFAEQNIKTAN
ncbi:Holliday junction resolvase RuvX [Polynucleobacter necessarius]|uniref:Holliday junction resolvase RuvX n=1 Tax=Polynucleobacter necessarius TaxID=576610 RepID=UPI000E093C4E|nr:Holliday junction resolvase RuvX [Polynucleobacter necessarius]